MLQDVNELSGRTSYTFSIASPRYGLSTTWQYLFSHTSVFTSASVEGLQHISLTLWLQGKVELYLGVFEEGTTFKTRIYCMKIDVDCMFFHVALLATIL